MNDLQNTIKPSKVLDVTPKAQYRVVVALSWEPKELTFKEMRSMFWMGLKDGFSGNGWSLFRSNFSRMFKKRNPSNDRELKNPEYDLDLACFGFDDYGAFISHVDHTAIHAIDAHEKFYHSGENVSGFGKHDDEQIHLELRTADEFYSHFICVIAGNEIHNLTQVSHARIRLIDSMSGRTFFEDNLSADDAGDNQAYIFCHIFNKDDDWHVSHIRDFCNQPEDWIEFLNGYIEPYKQEMFDKKEKKLKESVSDTAEQ